MSQPTRNVRLRERRDLVILRDGKRPSQTAYSAFRCSACGAFRGSRIHRAHMKGIAR